KRERLRELLSEEIRIAEDEAKLARDQHKAGTASLEKSLRADLDLLTLKREMADLEGDRAQVVEQIRQQLRTLEELQRGVQEQIKQGAASPADELKLRRQILSLQRRQAELE